MQSVLDRPVRADGLTDAFGIGGQAADIHALFVGSFVADRPFRFEHCEATQPLPLLRLVETLQSIEDGTAADFDAAMILFHALSRWVREWQAGWARKLFQKSWMDSASLG